MEYKTKSFKKYFVIILLLVSFIIQAQKKFVIVLDAGHGGTDHGASRTYPDLGRVTEKDVTLAVILKLGSKLEKYKDIKVIYTRTTDVYPTLTERTNLANRSKADLFVSVHVNASKGATAYGTETFVQGPNQNKENLEVAKAENDVIFLNEQDKQTFASYDPDSPESLIALKIQQNKYLAKSLMIGGLLEDNFVNKDKRFSRGVKQKDLHVLRRNAMPSILTEIGFASNYDEAAYISSESGQDQIAESIFNAIMGYKDAIFGKTEQPEPPKLVKKIENPLKNDFRILLMSSPIKYTENAPELRGLKYILILKEGDDYKYYYANTNYASVRDTNLKIAKDAGFKNAISIGFVPNQKLAFGYYTIELAVSKTKLDKNDPILALKDVERIKKDGIFYYTYGKYQSLEEAIKSQQELDQKGIKNAVIEKKYR